MFENIVTITTDNVRAARVLDGLKKKLSPNSVQRLYIAHLAGIENEDNTILGYIKYAFDTRRNIEDDYGNKHVLKVSEIVGMMRREKHRMEALSGLKS